MTPEQRARLTSLLPGMLTMARRKVSHNDFQKAMGQIDRLRAFLSLAEWDITDLSLPTAEEWIAIAEKASEGHDKPGVIKGMTMEQIRSGKPPEFFLKESNANENQG